MMSTEFDSVRVALRIRPLVEREIQMSCQQVVERVSNSPQILVNGTDAFTYNFVFDVQHSQEEIYEACVTEMVEKLFKGFNATILAYGQTGSGKTFTMGTAFQGGAVSEESGVIPRAIHDIFDRVQRLETEYEFVINCSFVELYQEQLYDLLAGRSREQSVLEIREDRSGIVIADLTKIPTSSAAQTAECLVRGSEGRAVAATAMNQHSSRSHAIFSISIEATKKDDTRATTNSKFHFVDLAGSERSKKTNATGDRFKEGVKINHGLLALGNVISELGSGKGTGFVRYRDSKLTRLLQDSLGGNSITLMIACVSPADYNLQETLSTLRYADRARKIKNKPIVNQDPRIAEINQLKSVIQKLRVQLLEAGSNDTPSGNLGGAIGKSTDAQSVNHAPASNGSKQLEELKMKYRNLQLQLQKIVGDLAHAEMSAHIAEVAYESLKTRAGEVKETLCSLAVNDFEDNSDHISITKKDFNKLVDLVNEMNKEFESHQSKLDEHKHSIAKEGNDNEDDSLLGEEANEEIQSQREAFTNKQMNFKEELRNINRELSHKVQLQQVLAVNMNKLCMLEESDNVDTDSKIKEYEEKIKSLETSKDDLLKQLQRVKQGNVSAKLAEERRKRLHSLEQEISEMKNKLKQQANLLRVRKNDSEKIKNLNSSIQSLKEAKVKLIRAMRQESESFRQWKLQREKEVTQLRNKGRKMENEMARKEALHQKQRNVLKRKCEEALAINKRLKDAMDKQRHVQQQRQKTAVNSKGGKSENDSKMERSISYYERELDLIISLFDAHHSLEHLIEDRTFINSRILELTKQKAEKNLDSNKAEELSQLQEELEMRNAQITEFQKKICDVDVDSQIESLINAVQSISESKKVHRYLIESISNIRREYANRLHEQTAAFEEQKSLTEAAEERYQSTLKRMRLIELAYQDAIAQNENTYEEKIAILLRELNHKAPHLAIVEKENAENLTVEQKERLRVQEEWLNKFEEIREELEKYKRMEKEKNEKSNSKETEPKPAKIRKLEMMKEESPEYVKDNTFDDSVESDDELGCDELEKDPDWQKTPIYRRTRTSRRTKSSDSTTDISNVQSRISCGCRKACASSRCGCRLKGQKCTSHCRCNDDCHNGKIESTNEENSAHSNDENQPIEIEDKKLKDETVFIKPALPNGNDTTFVTAPSDPDTQDDIISRTRISFSNTPKRKFFE